MKSLFAITKLCDKNTFEDGLQISKFSLQFFQTIIVQVDRVHLNRHVDRVHLNRHRLTGFISTGTGRRGSSQQAQADKVHLNRHRLTGFISTGTGRRGSSQQAHEYLALLC